jgi:uroporphyrin-III C-methyltransferase/precorrin-2 dehydrogenase/sirohydrochlorin ferrochelatase
LRAADIGFEVVPGVTAAFAAAAEAEIPLTLRGTASSLVFATGYDADGDTLPGWAGLALSGATVAVYMGRSVAAEVAGRLMQAGLDADTPVAVVANATLSDSRRFAGVLRDLAAFAKRPDIDGPALILIGRTAAEASLSLAAPLAPARTLAA